MRNKKNTSNMGIPALSKNQVFVFTLYLFLAYILPASFAFIFLDITLVPNWISEWIIYGTLFLGCAFFAIERQLFPSNRLQQLQLFSPLILQILFFTYALQAESASAIANTLMAFGTSMIIGMALAATVGVAKLIFSYKSPHPHKGDRFILGFFSLFLTIFFWIPAILFAYTFVVTVQANNEPLSVVYIVQLIATVVSVAFAHVKIMKRAS